MDWGFLGHNLQILAGGMVNTVVLAVTSLILSTLLAVPLALGSTARSRLVRWPVAVFSWAGRGTPELIILFFAFYGLSEVGLRLDSMPAAILAFTVFSSASLMEVFRGGFQGVARGQYDAAIALGMSYPLLIRRIIFPQVMRIVVAPYMTTCISELKTTSIASVIAVYEVTQKASLMLIATHQPFEILGLAFLIYVFLNSILVGLQSLLERWLRLKT